MDTKADDQLLKMYGHVTDVANQLQQVAQKVTALETKIIVQQGLIEIALGFIASKFGKEDYIEFLKIVANSDKHSKEAKFTASESLRQEALWPAEQLAGQKQ